VNANSISLVNTTFLNNTAIVGNGGAIHFFGDQSDLLIVNSLFSNNSASSFEAFGGAINFEGMGSSSHLVSNSQFQYNLGYNAGSLRFFRNKNLSIRRCTFIKAISENNSGGLQIFNGTNITIQECIFLNNTVFSNGGAMSIAYTINISITYSIFL
jgi:hypothetical protein